MCCRINVRRSDEIFYNSHKISLMKALILGSKGFIGQHLTNHFRKIGYNTWCADVITEYVNNEQYFLIDASNSDFSAVFQNEYYDICINCSGAASVPDSLINPFRDYYLNTVNVFKILEAIRKYQPSCKFMNLSSAAVYGNPKCLPVKESDLPNPLSPYGVHKYQSEQVCREFFDFFGIKTCSLRIFSVYGTGLRKQIFWDLHNKVKALIPFTLFGTGNESRDFIHVLDLVEAIDLIAKFSKFNSEVINVANGQEVFIKDVIEIYLSFFNRDINYTYLGSSRKGDPTNWLADIRKLQSFGYKPQVTMKTGLKGYFEWITSNNLE